MEINEYIDSMAKLLNGQLRGAINLKAREDNAELVSMTLRTVWDAGVLYGEEMTTQKFVTEKLKEELKDDDNS